MADPLFVEVSIEGGGSVRVTDAAQVEGVTTRALVRDADGIVRVTSWSDPAALRAALQAKLERVAQPPVESPPAGDDGRAVAAAVLEDFPRHLPPEGS